MKDDNPWFEFAKEDLRMAELAMGEAIYNQVCFHAQQTVEKLLKALIFKENKTPPKTHKLIDLFNVLIENPLIEFKDEIILLDRFYIPTRYPEALPGSLPHGLPSLNEAKEALAIARTIMKIVQEKFQ